MPGERRAGEHAAEHGHEDEEQARNVDHVRQLGRDETATIEPARYWPWPPMLKRPQRNANATARPDEHERVQRSSVCWRFAAADDAMSSVFQGNQTWALVNGQADVVAPDVEEPVEAGAPKIALYVLSVSATLPVVSEHDDAADQKGQHDASAAARAGPPAFWSSR